MTLDDLQVLIRDQAAFRRAIRKTDEKLVVTDGYKNEVVALLKGNFRPGRTPYIHQVVLPDGSQIRLKFVDTVKKLYNSKNVELVGKESFLSYLEIMVAPAGVKAYSFTVDVNQVVWGTSKSKATLTHAENLAKLVDIASNFDIDLEAPETWSRVYSENY